LCSESGVTYIDTYIRIPIRPDIHTYIHKLAIHINRDVVRKNFGVSIEFGHFYAFWAFISGMDSFRGGVEPGTPYTPLHVNMIHTNILSLLFSNFQS